MNYNLVEFKTKLAILFEKHGISFLNAIDKNAYIGFSPEDENLRKIENHFTFSHNAIGDANVIPLAYQDEELKKVMGISVYRGAYISAFIEDAIPLFKYYRVKSITCTRGGLYSIRWDDGNRFILENVDIEMAV